MNKQENNSMYYLEYLDNNGNIHEELKKILINEKDRKKYNVKEFLNLLNNFITKNLDKNKFNILKQIVSFTPTLCFGTIYYILTIKSNLNDESVNNVREYIDKEVDLFMIINFIREKR